jgi:chromosome segregation ATPase
VTDADRIRGLEETVTALQQRLAELAKLRDVAHEAKLQLMREHAAGRELRQQAQTEAERLRKELERHQHERNEVHEAMRLAQEESQSLRVRADASLAKAEDHERNEAHLRRLLHERDVAIEQARAVIIELQAMRRHLEDVRDRDVADGSAAFERADAWLAGHPEASR